MIQKNKAINNVFALEKLKMKNGKLGIKSLVAAACLAVACMQPALAVDVAGVKMDFTVSVADSDLTLNGAGVRTRFMFKVYALGLYVTEKKLTSDAVLAATGPRRVSLTLLRTIKSDEFSGAFIKAMNEKSTPQELAGIAAQIKQFEAMFALFAEVKTGDNLVFDWIPGVGTVTTMNGKKIGDTVADMAFYNAFLKIWIGNAPADSSLKSRLLGATN
jgi:hypothetical protein